MIEHALAYGALGLRIFPLVWHDYPDPDRVPGTPLVKWKKDATDDETTIRGWWQRWPKAGIGLACGDALADGNRLFVIDLDRHDPNEDGVDAWQDLLSEHDATYFGPTVLTAGGGIHLYYKSSVTVTNARGTLPKGIDVRGQGGYVVVPPSTHKSGGRHEWEIDAEIGEVQIPDAPKWLLKLLEEPERHNSTDSGTNKVGKLLDDRPGTEWADRTLWSELLEADGWRYHGTGSDGEEQWTRPGKEPRDGPSATVNYGGADRLVVHSTNANVPPDSYSRLGYLAAAHYGGDFSAASKSVAPAPIPTPPRNIDPVTGEILPDHDADHDGELDDGDDWSPVDVAEIARAIRAGEYEPELPEILEVADGKPLFYYGRSNLVFGSPGGGKTWIALAAVAERLRAGENVLFVDYEDSAAGTAERLVRLGVTDTELELLDYRSVATSLQYGYPTLDLETPYRLIVLDSTGEALAAAGINPNDDGEVAGFMSIVKRLTRRKEAPAVILLDHVPKSSDNPHGAPIGSQRKLAAATGSAYRCDTKISPAKGKRGRLRLVTAKDRLGHRAKGATAAEIDVADSADGSTIELTFHLTEAQVAEKEGKPFRPTHLMQRISEYLESLPGQGPGVRGIEKAVTGSNEHLRTGLERLVEEGYVRRTNLGGSAGFAHVLEKPYREDVPVDDRTVDPVDNYSQGTLESDSVSTVSPRVPPVSIGDTGHASSPTVSPVSPRVPRVTITRGQGTRGDGEDLTLESNPRAYPDEQSPDPVDNYPEGEEEDLSWL